MQLINSENTTTKNMFSPYSINAAQVKASLSPEQAQSLIKGNSNTILGMKPVIFYSGLILLAGFIAVQKKLIKF